MLCGTSDPLSEWKAPTGPFSAWARQPNIVVSNVRRERYKSAKSCELVT